MPSTRTEVPIVEIVPNGAPEKRNKPFATSWFAPVTYRLADGGTVDTTIGPFTRKRDAVAWQTERDVTNKVANFVDGSYVGSTTTYYLGGAR